MSTKRIETISPLTLSLAKTGITALVDEATGYQYDRPEDALVKLFADYIDEELAPWYARIPVRFWKDLFRLIGSSLNPEELRDRAVEAASFIHRVVFATLPPSVLSDLLNSKPKPQDEKFQQMLRLNKLPLLIDTGNETFDRQVVQVGALLSVAHDIGEFNDMFKRAFGESEASDV